MRTDVVKLVVPTDFEILEAMSDGKRQTAPNLAELLDKDSKYMNNRLAELAGKGLVEKVGPSNRSGMYVITERGKIAYEHRDEYSHDSAREFGALVEKGLEHEPADEIEAETMAELGDSDEDGKEQ